MSFEKFIKTCDNLVFHHVLYGVCAFDPCVTDVGLVWHNYFISGTLPANAVSFEAGCNIPGSDHNFDTPYNDCECRECKETAREELVERLANNYNRKHGWT